MNLGTHEIIDNRIILRIKNRVCETPEELILSPTFKAIVKHGINELKKRNSFLLGVFKSPQVSEDEIDTLLKTFEYLTKIPGPLVPNIVPGADCLMKDPNLFNDFVEYLYNFWRSFDRVILCDSTGLDYDKRPYRTFNATIGHITDLIRSVYRDIQENILNSHPRIYRQVSAGAEMSAISIPRTLPFDDPKYDRLSKIPLIRHILIYPPLILNPPMNKRTGSFERVDTNPLELINIQEQDWLCYPAKVGTQLILVYFHKEFLELGFSLCNLFTLAEDEDLNKKPDAIFFYGVPGDSLSAYGKSPTVFYEDEKRGFLVAAIPNRPEFGYFGYLKKMILTLHNIRVMRQENMPFHGALVRIILKGGKDTTLLLMGDTGAGKSETLEALSEMGKDLIQDMIIIADDMGSLKIDTQGNIIGYGSEIGAFLRLDDLKPGYAFGQMDRAIIMNPSQVNARLVVPVSTYENIIKGQAVNIVLYANNYQEIDDTHPLIEQFHSAKEALKVFSDGVVMSKGTTTTTGLVNSYFANIFGPPQYKDLHDPIAQRFFEAFFNKGVFVGQMRTRLGLAGWERKGPEAVASRLLELLATK